jgi:chromosome segregation ATPase
MRASEEVAMHRSFAAWRCIIVLIAVPFLATGVHAADKKSSKERELAQRVQQLQQEKSRLDQEKGELNTKVTELTEQSKKQTQQETKVKRDLAAARKESADLDVKLKAAEANAAELGKRLEEALVRIANREKEKAMLESISNEQVSVIGRQSRSIEACQAKNSKLYDDSMALLQRFKKTEVAEGGDPIFGLSRVKAFDTYQEFRDKFDAQRIDPPRLNP